MGERLAGARIARDADLQMRTHDGKIIGR